VPNNPPINKNILLADIHLVFQIGSHLDTKSNDDADNDGNNYSHDDGVYQQLGYSQDKGNDGRLLLD
jgi:hypothetical protein